MQSGEYKTFGAHAFFMHSYRNTSPVIIHRSRTVGFQRDLNPVAVTCQMLIHRIIHDFIYQMIQCKGLAGAYNHNVLKMAQEWMEQGDNHRLYVVGELGRHYFASKHIPVEEQFHYTVQNPTMHRARLISSTVLEDYEQGQLDEVWILYTQMINSMKMEAEIVQLLPLKREDFSNIVIPPDIIQEEIQMVPSPSAVMDNVVPNYVTGFIFGALVESFCSEQNARMMAMQSASDNANAILSDLSIEYNRVRQAAITQEITEVISGAKAQKKKHNS